MFNDFSEKQNYKIIYKIAKEKDLRLPPASVIKEWMAARPKTISFVKAMRFLMDTNGMSFKTACKWVLHRQPANKKERRYLQAIFLKQMLIHSERVFRLRREYLLSSLEEEFFGKTPKNREWQIDYQINRMILQDFIK